MKAVILLLVVGTALVWDILCGKIPNGLIFTGLISAFLFSWKEGGGRGILHWGFAILVPALLLWSFFYFRMLGAGDVKLFSVIGGFTGVRGLLICMAVSFLVGAVISLLMLFKRRIVLSRLSYFLCYISSFYRTGKRVPYRGAGTREGEFPFVIPIFISIVLYDFYQYIAL